MENNNLIQSQLDLKREMELRSHVNMPYVYRQYRILNDDIKNYKEVSHGKAKLVRRGK